MSPGKPHNRKSLRKPAHNYRGAHTYLITVCTKRRARLFGRIEDGSVTLSEAGRTVHKCWSSIPQHVPGASLDAFIVMPDHLHGILTLSQADATPAPSTPARRQICPGSLGAVVRSFKSASTRAVNAASKRPGNKIWLRGYHDEVIHPSSDIETVRDYIRNNPIRWQQKQRSGRGMRGA